MAKGQTDCDKLVGPQPEDVRRKFYPGEYGERDSEKDDAHRGGGNAPAPPSYKPFKLNGGS